ncbi:hypothetical protein WJX79_000580 [Trebouxia sp. C0005]
MAPDPNSRHEVVHGPFQAFFRTTQFWRRATGIYLSYKGAQAKAQALRLGGWDTEKLKEVHWKPHHAWAGEEMYSLCVDMRGFYLKVGQFLGARGDFMPLPVCERLSRLHDQVPPMPPAQTKEVIERELNAPLEDVFEWIDLEKPLGSASISQVHKAKLRKKKFSRRQRKQAAAYTRHIVAPGDDLGSIARANNVLVSDIERLNTGVGLSELQPGSLIRLPSSRDAHLGPSSSAIAAADARSSSHGPHKGIVAVKTEIKFDLTSAVTELANQIKLEFDFVREANIMDQISSQLQRHKGISKKIEIPCSVPGLVTRRLLVMNFLDGLQITRLGDKTKKLSRKKRKVAVERIVHRVAEAYGRQLLYGGLFQADGHPGNILVMKGARIGLIDYGQSKQLPMESKLAFAQLIHALDEQNDSQIGEALGRLGVVLEAGDPALTSRMAYGMFDTRGRVDPFDPNSPLKKMAVKHFPSDMFFVLRVVQLLRGLSTHMGVNNFSTAHQWRPFADDTLRQHGLLPPAKLWWQESAFTGEA